MNHIGYSAVQPGMGEPRAHPHGRSLFVLRFQGCVAGRRLLTRRGPCPEPPAEQGCAPEAPEAGLAGWPMRAPDWACGLKSWQRCPCRPLGEQRHKRLSGCEPRVFTRHLGRGRLVSLHHITATPLWACDGLMTRARRENHPIRSPFDSLTIRSSFGVSPVLVPFATTCTPAFPTFSSMCAFLGGL